MPTQLTKHRRLSTIATDAITAVISFHTYVEIQAPSPPPLLCPHSWQD